MHQAPTIGICTGQFRGDIRDILEILAERQAEDTVAGLHVGQGNIVNVVDAVDIAPLAVERGSGRSHVLEGDVAAFTFVVGEVELEVFHIGGFTVVNECNGHKRLGIGRLIHHTHQQGIERIGLSDIEAHLQLVEVDILVKHRHSIDTTVPETETVVVVSKLCMSVVVSLVVQVRKRVLIIGRQFHETSPSPAGIMLH